MSGSRRSVSGDMPLPSERPLAVDFLEKRALLLRDSNGAFPFRYDSEVSAFILPESEIDPDQIKRRALALNRVSTEVQQAKTSFESAVEKMRAKSGDAAVIRFDVHQGSDWKIISEHVQLAQSQYLKEDTISKQIFGRIRKVVDGSDWLLPFLKLLPDGQYKTLSGGLELVIMMMMQYSSVREKLSELINEFPDNKANWEAYQRLYGNDVGAKLRVEEMYVAVLQALQYVVEWYTESRIRTFAKVVFKGPKYSQNFDQRVLKLRTARLAFETEIKRCLHESTYVQKIVAVDSNARIRQQAVVEEDTNLRIRQLEQSQQQALVMMNNMNNMLGDLIINAKWNSDRDSAKLEASKQKIRYLEELRGKTYKISEFRVEVDLKCDMSGEKVLREVVGIGVTSNSRFRDRAQWLAASKECTGWFKRGNSSVLLVNGNDEVSKISPVSFLVALTTEKLRSSKIKIMVLTFFCGAYEDYAVGQKRGSSPIEAMVLELLQQLLSQCGVDDIVDQFGYSRLRCLTEESAQQVKTGSLQHCLALLCSLLELLTEQFDAVFVLIDGVEFLEDRWTGEICRLYRRLLRLIGQLNCSDESLGHGVVKLMVSASTRSTYFPQDAEFVSTVLMSEETDADKHVLENLEMRRYSTFEI